MESPVEHKKSMEKCFTPLVIGALYPAIERGLAADVLAARALGGSAFPVCASIVSAGRGVVTDLIEVPADSVDAQLEHVLKTSEPTGVKLGILGAASTVATVFKRLQRQNQSPVVLDLTLSGPSGEDVANERTQEALMAHIAYPDLVTLRRVDAELLASMEITTLDDAQVAAQRLHRLGARKVLLRCGTLPMNALKKPVNGDAFMSDLYYDGEDFALFEAPFLPVREMHGASSALTLSLLKAIMQGHDVPTAIQAAKSFVSEAIRHSVERGISASPDYFWASTDTLNDR